MILDLRDSKGQIIKLLPLLRLSVTTPRIQIDARAILSEGDILKNLILLRAHKVWRAFVLDCVSSISYRAGSGSTLRVTVKSSAREYWMPWDPAVEGVSSQKKLRAATTMWKIRAGLGQFPMPYGDVSED